MVWNAVTMGLLAAVAWGVHDFSVRLASRGQPIMITLLSVLFFGMLFQILLIVWTGEFAALPADAVRLSVYSGVCFLIASISLYVAFKRGPVKLVAPIIGGYPVISLFLASLGGTVPHVTQWVAVLVILAGISSVAISAQDDDQVDFDMVPTMAVAALAAVSFALTFELGQSAAALADERLSVAITRLVALGLLLIAMLAMQKRILPDVKTVPLLAFMGLMDTVALFCVLSAGGMDDAHFASATSSVFGLVTVLLSWLFLREKLSIPQWGGVALAFGGIAYLAL